MKKKWNKLTAMNMFKPLVILVLKSGQEVRDVSESIKPEWS